MDLCGFVIFSVPSLNNSLKVGFCASYGLLRVDTRSNSKIGEAILIHKKGSKVVGLHCNPVQPELLLSCGNDHFVSF
jgi:hypothetical protein